MAATAGMRKLLLIGGETALPAIAGILEELALHPDTPRSRPLLKVPQEASLPALALWPEHQGALVAACQPGQTAWRWHAPGRRLASLPPRRMQARACAELQELDLDNQRLWDRASAKHNEFYAWVAGESMAVMAIRRFFHRF